jgi:hypothetical protein
MTAKKKVIALIAALLVIAILLVVIFVVPKLTGGTDTGDGNPIMEIGTSDYLPNDGDYDDGGSADAQHLITFTSGGITAVGASVSGKTVTVQDEGIFSVSGTNGNAQIIIDAKNKTVRLIFDGLDLSCLTSAPVYIKAAQKVIITLKAETQNRLSDTAATVKDSDGEPSAALFAKSDLTINGTGTLTVAGNSNNAIQSKDKLVIIDSVLKITSVDDGIIGKDSLYAENAAINITSTGDGMRSTNDTDTNAGILALIGGTYTVVSGTDALQAAKHVLITGGVVNLRSGGGSSKTSYTASAKGIKGGVGITVNSGDITVDSADDCIHSNNSLAVYGGKLTLSSGDDGIHADTVIKITAGEIAISKSYEGIETCDLTITGGKLTVTASDDGINIAGGADFSASNRPGSGSFNSTVYRAVISGGEIYINSSGDGFDSNGGTITMSGGLLIVDGPLNSGDGAIDYDGTFTVTGGTVLAVGASGAQSPTSNSVYGFNASIGSAASGILEIKDSSGKVIYAYTTKKQYSSVVFLSPNLTKGTYTIYSNGASKATVTISSYLTSSGGSMPGGNGGKRPR